ncbi:MAG: ParB/RepB/Spo0J family partition protein [Phycisphaeraceae bacterium]|nr:ParB/RepB/Spo0J family partition protein [Phycisphaeraceae bacterium]
MNTTLSHAPVDALVCRPQVRQSSGYSDQEITGLARSIAESGGIHQPLLVRRDGDLLVVLDGERRLRAAKLAGLTTVPIIVEEQSLTEADVTHRQLVIDAQRVGLSPIERATSINRLMTETGWTAAQVAVKLGLSPASISKLLALLVLPPDVKEHLTAGRLAMSTAYEVAKVADSTERERLTAEAVNGHLSREAVVAKVRSASQAKGGHMPRRRTASPRERVVIPLGEGRSVIVSAPTLSIDAVVNWLTDLVERLRAVSADGTAMSDAVALVSSKRK